MPRKYIIFSTKIDFRVSKRVFNKYNNQIINYIFVVNIVQTVKQFSIFGVNLKKIIDLKSYYSIYVKPEN